MSRTSVVIRTGSRLHFGLLADRPVAGRQFGGLGVMIASPGWDVSLEVAAEDHIEFTDDVRKHCPDVGQRIQTALTRWRESSSQVPKPVAIGVTASIPAHRGLGSGTQLALAVARGLDVLTADGQASVAELARRTGRGVRSAVGTWGFESGGLLFDGGKTERCDIGTLVCRVSFPDDWRFVLISRQKGIGLSGDAELAAFHDLPGIPPETTERLCRIAAMECVPAIREHDFERASSALTKYGNAAGEYFVPVQGGVFADPVMEQLRPVLSEFGVTGLAQTSWGPTCAALCKNIEMAEDALSRLSAREELAGYDLRVVSPLNTSARIE